MTDHHPVVQPLSGVLEDLLREDESVTVGEITDRVDRRGFGLLMVLFALPSLIPVIPLGSVLIGLVYVLLAGQMLWGLERPWLPRRVRTYRIGPGAIRALHTRGIPLLRRMERLSRPRPLPLDERIITRIIAVAVLLLGIVLIGWLPFLNTLPALTVLIMGVGLLNRDGIFVSAGLLLTTGIVVGVVIGAGALYQVGTWLIDRLRGR